MTVLRSKLLSLKHELELSRISINYIEKMLQLSGAINLKQVYHIKNPSISIDKRLWQAEAVTLIDNFLKEINDERKILKSQKKELQFLFVDLKDELNQGTVSRSRITNFLKKVKKIADKVIFTHECGQAFKSIRSFLESII